MSQLTERVQLPLKDVKQHFYCEMKRVKAPKISRHKLQNEFACKGWNSCSLQFQSRSGDNEFDIVSSPTKFPLSSNQIKSSENAVMKKPMLVEISNIEPLFLKNRFTSKLSVDKLEQSFNNFIPAINKNHQSQLKRFDSESLKFQNIKESFQKKKLHTNFLKPVDSTSTVRTSDTSSCKVNIHSQYNSLDSVNKPQTSNSLVNYSSCKEFDSKCLTSNILLKNKISYDSVSSDKNSLETTSVSLAKNVSSFKDNEREKSAFCNQSYLAKRHSGDKSLSSGGKSAKRCLNNSDFQSSFVSNPVHDKCYSKDTNISIVDQSSPKVPVTLAVSKTAASSPPLKENRIYLSNTTVSSNCLKRPSEMINLQNLQVSFQAYSKELDISIEDQSSPTVPVFSEVSKTAAPSLPLTENRTYISNSTVRSNCLKRPSEVINLQNLQESFQAKKHCTGSNVSPESVVDMIFDDSPVKVDKDMSLNISYKFKIFSEIFGAESVKEAKDENKNSSQDIFIQDKSNGNVKFRTMSSDSSTVAFMDDFFGAPSNQDFSDKKSLLFNNKEFMETLQLSNQEKSFSIHKGSNWVQSLNWDQNTQLSSKNCEYNDQIEKKTLKNIMHGGFAEQMLKIQRRERSDKVIWNHKMNELKKKVATSSVTLTLMSVLCTGNIIMTKCRSKSESETFRPTLNKIVEDSHPDAYTVTHEKCDTNNLATPTTDLSTKLFIVLFKKEMLSKLQLKTGASFILYPPWEVLIVPSLPFPVILCTYFIEPINDIKEEVETEATVIHSYPVTYKNLQMKECECNEIFSSFYVSDSSSLYGKSVCVSARVQRMWLNKIIGLKNEYFLQDDYSSFALLLQTKDGAFLLLKVISSYLSDAYHDFMTDAESKCFRFCDVTITHRYTLKNCFKLKKFIESVKNFTENNQEPSRSQMFVYEIMPCYLKVPSRIPEENCPPYFDYNVKPLYQLQKSNQTGSRVSCIGKILFQFKEDFFITDESLLGSKMKKYINLKFSFKMLEKSIIGAIVSIKEALCLEDYLLVDELSKYEIFTASSSNSSIFSFESRIKKIGLINYEFILDPLNVQSKVKELVLVKGTISEVEESNALSWLECCYCFKENLLEDSNCVIYCEDCSCIVPKPVLKVKMDVTICCPDLSKAKIKVQLLSTTIKRILKISEDNYQPECNISDVLHKSTGDLCCYVRSIETISEMKIFHLKEVSSL